MPSPKPHVTVGIAVAVTLVAFAVAAIADTLLVRFFAVVLGTVTAIVLVRSAGSRSTRAGVAGVFLVPVVMLGLGTTVVGALTDGSDTSSTNFSADSDSLKDPDSRLAAALDRADDMLERGSSQLLSITIDSGSTDVDILDPATGRRMSSSDYGDGWRDVTISSAPSRLVFARSTVASLRLGDTMRDVDAAVAAMGPGPDNVSSTSSITVAPRGDSDNKLVATFDVGGGLYIEADMKNRLAGTLDAGQFGTVMVAANRMMADLGMNPARRNLRAIDFMALAEGSDSVGGSSIMIDGGVELEFDGGRYSRVFVKPGRFPVATERDEPADYSDTAFALARLDQPTLTAIRDDMMRRFSIPGYDRERVGFTVERSGSDDELSVQMSVGPFSNGARAFYSTAGVFLRTSN